MSNQRESFFKRKLRSYVNRGNFAMLIGNKPTEVKMLRMQRDAVILEIQNDDRQRVIMHWTNVQILTS